MDPENMSPDGATLPTGAPHPPADGSQAGDAASIREGSESVHLPEAGEVGMELVPPEVTLAPCDSFKALWEEEITLDWWQVRL